MEGTTYLDQGVAEVIERSYVPVKADHDARPDLAERYRDYGWPATIVMTAEGRELYKRAGYIAADEMRQILAGLVARAKDSSIDAREPLTLGTRSQLGEELRDELMRRHVAGFDGEFGGLDLAQKFIDVEAIELDLQLAARGDRVAEHRARTFLDAALKLIDPEFGGAYQYSTYGDWDHPHYEKIMLTQSAYLRAYSKGYAHFGDPAYRKAGERIAAYLDEFLRDANGGFYNSQDADLVRGTKAHDYFALPRVQRLQRGLPRIDKNQYASSNGMAIEGLVELYRATSDARHLQAALPALRWVLEHRRRADGGFDHGVADKAGPFLGDQLYVARAMLNLYQASKQRQWLNEAIRLAHYMERFKGGEGGLLSAMDNGTPVEPLPQLDQNIHATRFLLALYAEQADPRVLDLARHGMRFLATDSIATSRLTDAGILLADDELSAMSEKSTMQGDRQTEPLPPPRSPG